MAMAMSKAKDVQARNELVVQANAQGLKWFAADSPDGTPAIRIPLLDKSVVAIFIYPLMGRWHLIWTTTGVPKPKTIKLDKISRAYPLVMESLAVGHVVIIKEILRSETNVALMVATSLGEIAMATGDERIQEVAAHWMQNVGAVLAFGPKAGL
jgi:hypothetical protein